MIIMFFMMIINCLKWNIIVTMKAIRSWTC